ncbi:hypothetical protein [Rheinheimera sp. 1928-s]|uniref:hypothetical protein n=1 Tax=Rheinheimera sp. 1928-s TaxID=3033803 RepID=UPI0026182E7A|nr:hypothetical protein [Rheinheimera sp. 1928-s]MDF3127431.1 hypothetical protein [Rheinheimera sp. 1928-s]
MKRPDLLVAIGIAGFAAVIVMAVYPRPATTHAEYCAEEMVTRRVNDGRLVESRSCVSWVGWPIEVKEVQQ